MSAQSKRNEFNRTNSLCPAPETTLLEYVRKNSRQRIRRLIDENPSLLSHIYEDLQRPILLIAVTETEVEPETVQTLIDLGADLDYNSELDQEWQALHFASSITDSGKLQVVVDNLQSGKINELAQGSNALHILIVFGNSENEEEFLRCAKILIKAGVDLNLGDANNVSPVLWAAKKGYKSIVAAILENGMVGIDLDTHMSRNKTARQLINEKKLYEKSIPEHLDQDNNNDSLKLLFALIKQSNENGFINFNDGEIQEYVDKDDTSSTLLQYACQKGLIRAVKHLLSKGANPMRVTSKNSKSPIEIAAEHGYCEIFKYLLDNPHVQISPNILPYLVRKLPDSGSRSYQNGKFSTPIDHKKCYNYLIEKLKINKSLTDINSQDERSNTALHYAVRYGDPETIHELLSLDASLACQNKFNVMNVADIEPSILETHLDNCIEFDVNSKNFDKEDFNVTFNYRTLVPPQRGNRNRRSRIGSDYDAENEMSEPYHELLAETEVISYMSKAVEFKHLLKHPVIVSFLFMKWHRIRWLFYTNLAFYILFFLSLITYIFTYYVNFDRDKMSSTGCIVFIHLSFFLLCICFVLLTMRELFQMVASCGKYFRNFENYIEIVLIIITGCILMKSSPSVDFRKQISSIAILLAAFELVLMVGQHPLLSTNVVMLRTVSFNFFKFLLWYSLLIIAFSISFYILFTDSIDQKPEPGNLTSSPPAIDEEEEEKEENSFANPGRSVFKTIVMLTGEFEASDLNFHTFPILSKLIFVLFVFMIAIVLLNLLTGLAVSDTQLIKNDAELVGHIVRAQHIRYVESMLMGSILPESLIRGLKKLCCCFDDYDYNPRFRIRSLAKKACLFPEILNYELTFYPNKQGQVQVQSRPNRRKSSSQCLGCCANIYLDKETVARTNSVIRERREAVGEEEKRNRDKDERGLEKVSLDVRALQHEQQALREKLDALMDYLYAKNA